MAWWGEDRGVIGDMVLGLNRHREAHQSECCGHGGGGSSRLVLAIIPLGGTESGSPQLGRSHSAAAGAAGVGPIVLIGVAAGVGAGVGVGVGV